MSENTNDDTTPVPTIPEILEVVGNDPGLAERAREFELGRGDAARRTLLVKLARIIESADVDRSDSFVDGGGEFLPVPAGKTVAVVTDRKTLRVVDPDAYEATEDGLVQTAGGTWAKGTLRWSLDFAD